MQFVSTFDVPAPIDEAWTLLGDIPKIAPCLPGATVRPLDEDNYEGEVIVKVGPIRAGYSGRAKVIQRDEQSYVMVLEGKGSESGGKGTASAVITLALSTIGPTKTRVEVTTDLTITGRLAQFGRSAMADVSRRLVAQFATNLAALAEGTIAEDPSLQSGRPSTNGSQQELDTPSGSVSPLSPTTSTGNDLDVMTLALPIIKRSLPVIGGLAGALLAGVLIGSSRGHNVRGRAPQWADGQMVCLLLPVDTVASAFANGTKL